MTLSQERLVELIELVGSSQIDDPDYATMVVKEAIDEWPWAIKTATDNNIDEDTAWKIYMNTISKVLEEE